MNPVAAVRAIAHVNALSVYSRTHAPGEKPKLLEVKEQRLTAFAVHVVIGMQSYMRFGAVLQCLNNNCPDAGASNWRT